MKRGFLEYLVEAAEGPRIPHPEDSVFDGIDIAQRYVTGLLEVMQRPQDASIKWDGGIALYFGRNQQGQFVMTDKYMPSKGVYPTSPEGWIEYDRSRGADRADLYQKIATIWSGLEAAVGNTTGLFKGDLMAIGEMTPVNGQYVFRPTTVEYHIPVNSNLGKLITGKVGVVVVHQFEGKPWDGKSGLANVGNVAVLPPGAYLSFKLTDVPSLSQVAKSAQTALATHGANAQFLLDGLPKVARDAIKTYTNKHITKQTTDAIDVWLQNNISNKQYQYLVGDNKDGYLVKNKAALASLFAIWNAIYVFKVALVQQLESQIQGFQQFINGQPGGEGFVFPSSVGLIKLVNRESFGSAHFAKQR
jgi:hypothetical protein